MSPRTGRPKTDNPRSNAVHIRFADDELAQVKEAAEDAGTSTGDYMRTVILAAAKRRNRKKT
jgi:prolyl-tRNA editing enzyme YbaK/EbsC (Cys-tRNA(Pro) deacylase)